MSSSNQLIIFLLATLLLLSSVQSNQQAQIEHAEIGGNWDQQQGQANYHGSFDSQGGDWAHAQQDEPLEDDFDNFQNDGSFEATEHDLLQFSEYLGDFMPDQTFTFKLEIDQQQIFMLYPDPNVVSIRGMFQSEIDSSQDLEEQGYIDLQLFENDVQFRTYRHQRLGIFNIPHTTKDHHYKLKFITRSAKVDIYLSYQIVTKTQQQQKNVTQSPVQEIYTRFQKVNMLLARQEQEITRLVGISEKHQTRIEAYVGSLEWNLLLQTLVIVLANWASLHILKRQIMAGYQVV